MGLTLLRVELRRPPARRSRLWMLIGWCSVLGSAGVAGGGVGAMLRFAGGVRGLGGLRARPAGR